MADKLQQIVERMISAGESEEDIAAVIQHYKTTQPAEPKPEGRSVGGFLENALSSTGRLIADTVKGLPALGSLALEGIPGVSQRRTAEDHFRYNRAVEQVPAVIRAAGKGIKDRYGSLENIGTTLYEDPAGVAADISTIASLGAGAAAKAPRLAGVLSKVERATNPLQMVTKPLAKAADVASDAVIAGTLRPSKAVREDFGGRRGVAQAVKKERVYSEANAERKLAQSTAQADALLKAREAAGVRGVPARNVADAVTGKPTETAGKRAKLGVGDQSAVSERRARILAANKVPGQKNAVRLIPLTEAQALKREAQDLAFEASKNNLSVEQQMNSAIGRALREGIEQRVPEVGPINERSQRLLGTKRAFDEAQDRPRALTNMLSLMTGAGGAAIGGPSGMLGAALIKAGDSPRLGAMTGIGINELGRGMNNAELLRAALLSRLVGEVPDE